MENISPQFMIRNCPNEEEVFFNNPANFEGGKFKCWFLGRAQAIAMPPPIKCLLCNLMLNGPCQAQQHLKTKRHLKNLKKQKKKKKKKKNKKAYPKVPTFTG